ncbi:MAG: lysophospholipid acyltransferase family protein [Elusimicrobiota bacterium]|jgi:KDO2-lipid IV(A) lauroyltransferase|nr:lysophospholipid acyltransferase family protein [Elusimicrobiota bacterium]
MIKKIRRQIYYFGALIFSKLVLLIPYKWAVGGIAEFFGKIAPHFTRDASAIAKQNLQNSFPQKSQKQIDEIVKNVFINQTRNFFELANFPKVDLDFLKKISKIENADLIFEALKKNKGILFVSAHTGNWEITAAAVAALGIPVNVVAKKIYVEGLNDMLVGYRMKKNINVILKDSKDTARKLLRALKKGEIIAMLVDQDTDVPSVFVNFFGRKAWTPSGLASLALRTGAEVLIGIDRRDGKFNHTTIIEGPVRIETSGDFDKDVVDLTQKATSMLEDHIRKYPDQWVWFHKRWKTQDGLGAK